MQHQCDFEGVGTMPKRAAMFYGYLIKDGEVYGQGRRQTIEKLTDLYPEVINTRNFDEHAARLGNVEVIFATRGMPCLTEEQLAKIPKLKAVFYAAGNVKAFAQPVPDRSAISVMVSPEPFLALVTASQTALMSTSRGGRPHRLGVLP